MTLILYDVIENKIYEIYYADAIRQNVEVIFFCRIGLFWAFVTILREIFSRNQFDKIQAINSLNLSLILVIKILKAKGQK